MSERHIHGGRYNCCKLCEHYDERPFEPSPCYKCRHKVTPKEPAKRLIIEGVAYILEEQEHE